MCLNRLDTISLPTPPNPPYLGKLQQTRLWKLPIYYTLTLTTAPTQQLFFIEVSKFHFCIYRLIIANLERKTTTTKQITLLPAHEKMDSFLYFLHRAQLIPVS